MARTLKAASVDVDTSQMYISLPRTRLKGYPSGMDKTEYMARQARFCAYVGRHLLAGCVAAASAMFVACGRPSPPVTYGIVLGAPQLSVTQAGQEVASLVSAVVTRPENGASSLSVIFGNVPGDLCQQAQANTAKKSTHYFRLDITVDDQNDAAVSGPPTEPGTYANVVGALITSSDDAIDCPDKGSHVAMIAGSKVTLTDVGTTSTPTRGSVDILLEDGSMVTGTFLAPPCTLTNVQIKNHPTTTCY